MMITPLIFSLLAFFIVTTTTIVVIKNKSRVNNLDKTLSVSKLKFENDKYENQKKIQNLVNEVNLNNKRLEQNQQKTKAELQLDSKKTNNNLGNLDKRFNSYKNITTANFIGINNRMTEENTRLQEDIARNRKNVLDNKITMNAMNIKTNERIDQSDINFNSFENDTYRPKMTALDSRNNAQDLKFNEFQNSIAEATIDSSKFTLDARKVLNDVVVQKDLIVKNSLDNFFNTTNFVTNNSTKVADPNLFSTWFDDYNNIGSYGNFQTFDELLINADKDMNTMREEQTKINNLQTQMGEHKELLSSASNLNKTNLYEFVENTYNFNMNNLAGIATNNDKINGMQTELSSLSNMMKDIAVIDTEGNSTMSLQELNNNIVSNARAIDNIDTTLASKLNTTNFNTELEANLASYSNTITDNLNVGTLIAKLGEQDMLFKSVNAEEINTNKLMVDGEDFTDKVNKGENYLKNLDKVFGLDTGTYSGGQELLSNPLIKIRKPGSSGITGSTSTWIEDDKLDESNKVEFAPGTDLQLSSTISSEEKVGGRIILDSFDDIGLVTRSPNGKISNDIKWTDRFILSETLGGTLSNLDTKIKNLDTKTTHGGMDKDKLYNIIHNNSVIGAYNNLSGRQGEFKDSITDSFRIKDLYTGKPPAGTTCYNDSTGANNQDRRCKTLDDRLDSLETKESSFFNTDFNDSMINYGGNMGSSGSNLNINSAVVNIDNTLSVKTAIIHDTTVNNDLRISTNGKIILEGGINNIVTENSLTDTITSITDSLVMKNSPDYIKELSIKRENGSSKELGFTYTKGNDESVDILFPASTYNVEPDDIKSISITDSYDKNRMENGDTQLVNFHTHRDPLILNNQINIPKTYIHSIDDSIDPNNYIFKVVKHNNNGLTDFPIQKGLNDRNSILDKLSDGINNTESTPKFKNIKFGDQGCLSMTDGKLLVCDSDCNPNSCFKVWDRGDAPEPVITKTA
jgi:hypothetical protein